MKGQRHTKTPRDFIIKAITEIDEMIDRYCNIAASAVFKSTSETYDSRQYMRLVDRINQLGINKQRYENKLAKLK